MIVTGELSVKPTPISLRIETCDNGYVVINSLGEPGYSRPTWVAKSDQDLLKLLSNLLMGGSGVACPPKPIPEK